MDAEISIDDIVEEELRIALQDADSPIVEVDMSKPISTKRELFCQEYVKDLDATKAVIRAGYTPSASSKQLGWTLLRIPSIRARIQQILDERAYRCQITSDRVLYEIAKLAFSDITKVLAWEDGKVRLKKSDELTPEDAACISEIKEDRWGRITFKLHDKLRALEMLGRHLVIFKDRLDINVSGAVGNGGNSMEVNPAELTTDQLQSMVTGMGTNQKVIELNQ